MKLMIASDIHGSAFYCRQLLEAYEREQPDRLLLLGDILYHGPRNDLPDGYAPKQVISMLNAMKSKLLCVRGNCDTEVDQMVLEFPVLADYCIIPAGEHLIYATHGHVYNPQTPPPLCDGDILLQGHTHVPKCEAFSPAEDVSCICMNPGSVSIPKENSQHGYMMLEKRGKGYQFIWKDLAGEAYYVYDL